MSGVDCSSYGVTTTPKTCQLYTVRKDGEETSMHVQCSDVQEEGDTEPSADQVYEVAPSTTVTVQDATCATGDDGNIYCVTSEIDKSTW